MLPKSSNAQLVFNIDTPNIDSFPVVRIGISVTDSGKPASLISPSDFAIKEDGLQVNVFDLFGCGGSSSAAIAFVIDTSNSMDASVSTGPISNRSYAQFFDSYSKFIANVPAPSDIALVPFADSSTYSYPGPPKNFYSSASGPDTTAFVQHLTNLSFYGGTDVASGLIAATQLLSKSMLPRKVIILATDDGVSERNNIPIYLQADSVQHYLQANGVTLFIMEVARDTTNYNNIVLAEGTGGAYFAATDPSMYTPTMLAISNLIFSEHCTLRYVSHAPCPWWKKHTIEVDVNYQKHQLKDYTSYTLGSASKDTIPPRFQIDSSRFTTRVIHAYDPFPCESGMMQLTDSALQNFRSIRSPIVGSDSASDSIGVADSLYPASGYYIARDSAGNISRVYIHYNPKPDTNPPQLGLPSLVNGLYVESIEELLPWDRGIASVVLAAGAANLVLDSVVYSNKQFARAYLHVLNLQDSASGCLIAQDSVGNTSRNCIAYFGISSNPNQPDILPPVFAQNALAEPRVVLTGVFTEMRAFDKGIRTVTVTPLSNMAFPAKNWISIREVHVSAAISDSLYPATAMVEAYDSLYNYTRDTMHYSPLPDTFPPLLTYTTVTKTSFQFSTTEIRPWDRGVESLTLLPTSTNVTASPPLFADADHASIIVTVTDRTQDATMTVSVIDSVGHETLLTANFTGIPIIPFGDSTIDFGSVVAPATIQRTLLLTNPNDIPITLDISQPAGDDSIFTLVTPSPITFAANATQPVTFEFHPNLLGTWNAVSTLMQDTTHLGSITLSGQSTGVLSLSLDTASVAHQGIGGNLHLSIDATPKPINLDTIAFSIQYDPDVISLGSVITCRVGSPDTGICLYDISMSGTPGNMQAQLNRRTPAFSPALSFGITSVQIPFMTYLAKHDSTVVHLSITNAPGISSSITHDGLVVVGDTCGTPILRAEMNDALEAQIESISPNPASSSIDVLLKSQIKANGELRFVAMTGAIIKSIPIALSVGDQSMTVSDLPRASGSYEISLVIGGRIVSTRNISILK
ncbi:MAG TPA: VWA domain-containing protein [Candidatus Kapabacteria bacterium]|jgi:hypothetical protein|nr:VWA domain-containing protein [Candidatus Kapabacteria bacterium]